MRADQLSVKLFKCFLDAAVSEQIARMVAMKAATENADTMISSLSMAYNRARQGQITSRAVGDRSAERRRCGESLNGKHAKCKMQSVKCKMKNEDGDGQAQIRAVRTWRSLAGSVGTAAGVCSARGKGRECLARNAA